MKTTIYRSVPALLSSALALAGGIAHAQGPQAAETAAERGSEDDIIVTARRREESLQDVPVSIAALTPTTLQQNNIGNVAELSRIAPSLISNPGQNSGKAYPVFAIRGQSQQEATMLADPAVPVYIGDIVAARTQGVNGALFDLAAVEVLRGPQGTLFGRNSTGGAVVLRANRPVERFEGMASVTGGSRGMFNAEAMLNIPINDYIQVRVAGSHRQDDGFVFDEILGRNMNDTNQQAVRAAIRLIDPASGIESITTYDYFHENDGGTGTYLWKLGNTNPATGSRIGAAYGAPRRYVDFNTLFAQQQARGMYRIATGVDAFTRVETHTVQNVTTIPILDGLTIKNIMGYREVKDHVVDDADGTVNALQQSERRDFTKQFTEEFQAYGTLGRLNYIVGGYYFRESGLNTGMSTAGAVNPVNPLTTVQSGLIGSYEVLNNTTLSNTEVGAVNESYAAFGQVDYEVVDGLTLTGGIRFNTDRRSIAAYNRFFANFDPDSGFVCRFTRDLNGDGVDETPAASVPQSQCVVNAKAKFSKPTYTLSASYQIDQEHLVYLAHRHGYRTGGFAARAGTEQGLRQTFAPEFVDDVELGFKGDWHLGSTFLRTNLAGYYAKYRDLQRALTQTPTGGGPATTVAVNIGKARIWGIEADVLFRPVEQLELTANYAYTNARYTEFFFGGVDHKNEPFARAPKNVYTLGARFRQRLNDQLGEFSLGGSLYHTDAYNGNESYAAGLTDVDGYSLVNMDMNFRDFLRPGLDLQFFVTNLTKKKYDFLFVSINAFGFNTHTPGTPRTFGATLRYKFGS